MAKTQITNHEIPIATLGIDQKELWNHSHWIHSHGVAIPGHKYAIIDIAHITDGTII